MPRKQRIAGPTKLHRKRLSEGHPALQVLMRTRTLSHSGPPKWEAPVAALQAQAAESVSDPSLLFFERAWRCEILHCQEFCTTWELNAPDTRILDLLGSPGSSPWLKETRKCYSCIVLVRSWPSTLQNLAPTSPKPSFRIYPKVARFSQRPGPKCHGSPLLPFGACPPLEEAGQLETTCVGYPNCKSAYRPSYRSCPLQAQLEVP